MSKNVWIVFIAICVVLLGGLVFLTSRNRIDVSAIDINSIQPATAQSGDIGDHTLGKTGSKVVLIQYGDFQCPGCGSVYPRVKSLTDTYKDQIEFVFRNFPLTTMHPNARAAAAAAEAAGLQGKYWEMHDKLYVSQSDWENLSSDQRTAVFTSYAKDIGVKDTDKFTRDMGSDAVNRKISFDQAVGKKANVQATPTFFINGALVDQNTWGSDDAFKNALLDAMKQQGIEAPAAKTESEATTEAK